MQLHVRRPRPGFCHDSNGQVTQSSFVAHALIHQQKVHHRNCEKHKEQSGADKKQKTYVLQERETTECLDGEDHLCKRNIGAEILDHDLRSKGWLQTLGA